MDTKLEAKLVEKYPNLYSRYGGDIRETCMGWGMSCGDGWFKLLDELSANLEPLNIVAAQVKEKFGGLRFYIEGCDESVYDKVYALIDEAEHQSYKICETCGKDGELRQGGWMVTACDECQKEYEAKGQ
jgi:hypothetical protein